MAGVGCEIAGVEDQHDDGNQHLFVSLQPADDYVSNLHLHQPDSDPPVDDALPDADPPDADPPDEPPNGHPPNDEPPYPLVVTDEPVGLELPPEPPDLLVVEHDGLELPHGFPDSHVVTDELDELEPTAPAEPPDMFPDEYD